ncbi:lytic transglycosylase domain-containing protein [Methylobacterium haplocladii]|uniref:Lytic transglycosylase n=1 Tax=Methylobacterium haplocladii TaxID=1176176 RepID=A0A512IKP5_9HYPH|nr:lytic transglycosylase domain-containing protein [Methylobacterium haplocladii]GEO98208.1 lytic transglycosylase [Methylobacterium haplocladii]GJD84397.1 Membrane-bound lytic murein transglycosylase F [Methylobacterium haplocladii]GLS60941.1 lytic transglycosylase [Methylobacterium haplocladii]
MAVYNRPRLLAALLLGGVAVAGPVSAVDATGPATTAALPASDADVSSARLKDTTPSDPVAADALKTEPSKSEASKGEASSDAPLPAAASSYASTDTDTPVAFPLPDAVASPAAPVPEVPDPARALFAGDTDLAQLRQAIDLYRRGKFADGDRLRDGFKDPAARALCEWVAIRAGTGVDLRRITAFLRDNAGWPAGPLVRRRAEERLLAEKKDPAQVRAYFATAKPETAPGKLALALAFKADGLDADAADLVRDLWRTESFGRAFEARVMDAMPGILGTIDHRTRMERALLKEDWEMAGRAAGYAGGSYASLVRARRVVEAKGSGAPSALNAVPPSLRNDSSFMLSRAQYYRRAEKFEEAAKILAAAPTNPDVLVDGDEWWVERRIVARKLIDQGDAKTAYAITSGHSARTTEKRIEAEFHAGWIALRFSGDAKGAQAHFAKAAEIAETPISVARAAYWQGRAADQLGNASEARAFYERAAGQPIAYYGQLARARLGQSTFDLRRAADLDGDARKAFDDRLFVRALKLLSAAVMKDLALPLYIDAAKLLTSEAEVNALGDVALQARDARALVAIGKLATQRGLALDTHAYPTIGIPDYEAFVAVPQVERAMVFAIARQESQFDPRAQSGVGARGLMQMMPATASRTAKRVSTAYEQGRLTSDPAYCARLGQAHLGELMEDWRGSYILAFASYNAGGGNVKKWIDAYGDPRKPGIDPIDWVERIPFTETRNYVQRVMENLQVYRNRLGVKADGKNALLIEQDFARGAKTGASAEATPTAQ